MAEGHASGLAEGRASGLAEGHASGLAEGRASGLAEGRASGLVEGALQNQIEIVMTMHEKQYDLNSISEITKLSINEIQAIINNNKVN